MTKEELVHLTLKQLSESLKTSPENFRLEDPTLGPTNGSFPGPTVIWQFRVQLEEHKYIVDPLNSIKTIIVTQNTMGRNLQCYIYHREVNNFNHSLVADASATIDYSERIPLVCYRTYRQFNKLRKQLAKKKHDKEFIDYMKRLNGIFPATHEDDIFQ